jgi:hypothetical protein
MVDGVMVRDEVTMTQQLLARCLKDAHQAAQGRDLFSQGQGHVLEPVLPSSLPKGVGPLSPLLPRRVIALAFQASLQPDELGQFGIAVVVQKPVGVDEAGGIVRGAVKDRLKQCLAGRVAGGGSGRVIVLASERIIASWALGTKVSKFVSGSRCRATSASMCLQGYLVLSQVQFPANEVSSCTRT